jgi:hypothetical protein
MIAAKCRVFQSPCWQPIKSWYDPEKSFSVRVIADDDAAENINGKAEERDRAMMEGPGPALSSKITGKSSEIINNNNNSDRKMHSSRVLDDETGLGPEVARTIND